MKYINTQIISSKIKITNIMKSFWNKITILIILCAIIIPILNFLINLHHNLKDSGIADSITLMAVFITILSTLYSNYKSDERVQKQIKTSEKQFKEQLKQNELNLKNQLIYNKKQEICIELYAELDNYWRIIDKERIEFLEKNIDYDPYFSPNTEQFRDLNRLIYSYHFSAKFYYLPKSIQNIITDYIIFKENNPNFDIMKRKPEDEILAYLEAFTKLHSIFPQLRKELGKSL